MLGAYVSFNGNLIPKEQAVILVNNIEWTYGFGVYENLKVRDGFVYFIHEHVERLFYSAATIGLQHLFTKEHLKTWIQDLVAKNAVDAANIKMLLIGGETEEKAALYIMTLSPKFLDKKYYRQGVHVITKQYERYLPQAKTLNMLPSYLLFKEASAKNAHDVLLTDREGYIIEGTRSNFFAIKNTTLFTASTERVLNGVTRQTVIRLALAHNYTLTETPVLLDNIADFDGAFLTHTSGKIVPIKSIDTYNFIEVPTALRKLMRLYDEHLKSLIPTSISHV